MISNARHTGSEFPFAQLAGQLKISMRSAHMNVPVLLQFNPNKFQPFDLEPLAASRLRVVFVTASTADVRAVAMAAAYRGIVAPGWAWLGLDTVRGAEIAVAPADADRAKAALKGWLLFEPANAAPDAFFGRVQEATNARFPEVDGAHDSISLGPGTPRHITPFAANMFDAVLLFTNVARGLKVSSLPDGASMAKAMLGTAFDGMMGRVEFDKNADLKQPVAVLNYVLEFDGTMRAQRIGVYDMTTLLGYSPVSNCTIVWPGGTLVTPAALLTESEEFSTLWISLGGGAGAILVVGSLLLLARKRYAVLRSILLLILTEVTELALGVVMELADLGTDWVTYGRVLSGDIVVPKQSYKVLYSIFVVLGTLVVGISVAYRLRNARKVRQHLDKLAKITAIDARRHAGIDARQESMVQEHLRFAWELKQLQRALVVQGLIVLTILVQGAVRFCSKQAMSAVCRRLQAHVCVQTSRL